MATNQVDLSQDTIEKLAAGISKGLGGGGSGGSSKPPPEAGGGWSWLGAFKTGVQGSTDALGKLASGSLSVSDAFGKLAGGINGLDPTGLSKGLTMVGQAGIDTTYNLNKLGKDVGGLDFAGNAAKFNSNAKTMGLTQEESMRLYQRNMEQMTGLGSTVNQSANNFGQFQEAFSKNKFSAQLSAMGISMEEQAELGAAYVSQNRFLNLQDQAQRERTIASFANYATQLDENARLTGMSKKAQSDAVNEQAKNVRVMAAVSQMGEGAMEKFKNMQGQIVGLGENVQKAASALYTGGPKTAEERAAVAAMGPAAATFQKAVEMSKNAQTEGQREEARIMMERAKNEINAYQRSKEFTDAVQTGVGPVADAMRQQYEQNKYGAAAQFTAATTGAGKTPADQAQIAEAQAAAARTERLRLTPEGKADPGAAVTQAINLTDRFSKEVAAGTTPAFEKLNTTVGETSTKFDAVNKIIGAIEGGGVRKSTESGIQTVTDKTGQAIPGTEANRTENSRLGNIMNRLGTRDLGTWGMTGQMFEPMDQVVKISRGEIVLDPEQAKSFVANLGKAGPAEGPPPSAPAPQGSSALNDMVELLNQLNMQMGQLVAHSSDTATYSKRQVSAIKNASGNMWA